MVSFALTDEQKMMRDLARDFAINEMVPKAAQYDKSGEYPWEILQKAWEAGLLNVHIEPENNGPGLSDFEEVLIAEELNYGCSGMATAMFANNLAIAPVLIGGSPEIKKKYLEPMTNELKMAAYAVTEPGAGSDVANLKTKAVKKGDEYILNGSKMWITNAGVADWFFVLARTDDDAGHHGFTSFIVDAKSPGITVGKKEINMGQRCSDTRGIVFEDVKIPKNNVIGKEGEGFKVAMAAFDHTRPAVAAGAVGVARAALEHAAKYANVRYAFEQPIIANQGISFPIADMAKDIEAGRLLCWQAAWLVDNGYRNTYQASIAKAFCADMCVRVCTDAVQVFGGYGFMREYPISRAYVDARAQRIYGGANEIMRELISRSLLD